jgi:hypothetical protein
MAAHLPRLTAVWMRDDDLLKNRRLPARFDAHCANHNEHGAIGT